MKKTILVLALTSINFSAVAAETSWLDSLKSFVGLNESTPAATEETVQTAKAAATDMLNTDGLLSMLTSSLNVSDTQAEGGMGSIFNYVKENVSVDDFSQLASALPGVDSLLGQVPETADTQSSSGGLSGMLDTASQYSDSLKSINDVKKQFEALGLDTEMIGQYISSAQSYLNTPEGAEAKKLFTQGVEKLIGA